MANDSVVSYSRAPSDKLRCLLKEGFLAPICRLPEEKMIAGRHLDVHFRPNNHIQVYLGSAQILDIGAIRAGGIMIGTNQAYRKHGENLFRKWKTDESGFEDTLRGYLERVVNEFPPQGEGKIQERWSLASVRFGQPWTTFDREARLNYESTEQREKSIGFPEVESAHAILRDIAHSRPNRRGPLWTKPPPPRKSQKVDQLGIDENGNFVLIELKDANSSKESSIFYSPLQLLRYIHEWRAALSTTNLLSELDAVIEARRDLGLMPTGACLGGKIRAAICFGDDARSEEVKRRYYEVLGVVNSHRPLEVLPVETWIWPEGKNRPESL